LTRLFCVAAACAITTDILQLVGLKSFRVAGVMLVGLLLYDVFWVFGSPSAIGDNVSNTGPQKLHHKFYM
jgi:minor histocompatibility antigen H13